MPSESTTPGSKASSARRSRGPGRPRREEGSPELRASLLDAATELAVERGFDAVGLREIAERAGASPAMISYYFGDREGLYDALFQRAFDGMAAQVEALLDPKAAATASFEELVRVHVSALAADPWMAQLIAREVLARDTRVRQTFAERVGSGPLRLMVQWIEAEIGRGRLRADLDPRLTAMSVAALAVFPYLFAPILGPQLGIELDEEFSRQLIAHNQKLLAFGTRAHGPEHEE